jgi:hypothetical protein
MKSICRQKGENKGILMRYRPGFGLGIENLVDQKVSSKRFFGSKTKWAKMREVRDMISHFSPHIICAVFLPIM